MKPLATMKQKTKVKNIGNYNVDETRKDALDKLITTPVQDISIEKRIINISDMQEELCEINELATKVVGNMQTKKQEDKWEEITKDYREMIKGHKEMQEEKNKELQRLNCKANDLRYLNRTYGERKRQQQEWKKKVKQCK